MKEFMMIFIGGSYKDLSPDQMQARMQKWMDWVEDLRKEDLYIDGRPLQAAARRIGGESKTVTDGPFVDSKELVGGYFIVKAKDMDQAVGLTGGYPDYDMGGQVEVREIMTL